MTTLLTDGRRRGASVLALAATIGVAHVAAAVSCDVPDGLPIAVAQRGIGASGSVVATDQPPGSPLRPGDVVRQASAYRVAGCGDLERAASEVLARGLPLLLAVDRGGALIAVLVERGRAAEAPPPASVGTQPEGTEGPTAGPAGAEHPAATAAMPRARVAAEPEALSASPPPPRLVEVDLPPVREASPELRRAVTAALAELQKLDTSATLTVPLAAYERRLDDAEGTIHGLSYGSGAAAATLSDAVEAVLALHRTARDIRRARIEYIGEQERSLRTAAMTAMPYFSDSEVPRWVAEYPFLRASLIEPPRPTRLVLAGERAGQWNPDRALELLWGRARDATARLAAWAAE